MDISQLRAFLAVAEELHFGRAAEKLHRAQPPLSRTIRQLERDLGTTLFIRSTRSVQLTASGQALVGPAREVLEALRRAEAMVRAADDGSVGLVRIAFAGASTHRLVARIARDVRSQRPGIELKLSSQDFAQPAMKKLVNGDTDIALGRWDSIPASVITQVVQRDSLVLAVADTHPLAAARQLTAAELAGQQFVSLPPQEGAVLPDRLRRLAQIGGFVSEIVQIVPDTQTALALVSAEVGCHLTLKSVADNVTDPGIAFIPIAEDVTDVDLRVASRRDEPNPAVHAVLGIVLDS